MKKLKLQVQTSIDGFVGGPNGELDWMTWNWSEDIKKYVNDLHTTIDTILLGRKMTDGFVTHWENVPESDESYAFSRVMVDTPKVVFSKTLTESKWNNTTLASGDITEEVNNLKNKSGKDLIVYGGAGFNSSLVKANLIDEYYLFINPTALGNGISIFGTIEDKRRLDLTESKAFDCGIVLLKYAPKQ
ncbi:MAG TPA: dihydrofolate reductase family protein [Candidatus Kapabacteria bacterium]|nr:dihydrofolate reductase family protein [Candidatus Kapabacteria bacterium]